MPSVPKMSNLDTRIDETMYKYSINILFTMIRTPKALVPHLYNNISNILWIELNGP